MLTIWYTGVCRQSYYMQVAKLFSKAPFTLEINFKRKNFQIFLSNMNTFHTGNKLSKANIDDAYGRRSRRFVEINFRKPTSTTPMDDAVDASFDVCKHWPITALHKRNFCRNISQNITCSKLRNRISKFIPFEICSH